MVKKIVIELTKSELGVLYTVLTNHAIEYDWVEPSVGMNLIKKIDKLALESKKI